MEHVTVVFKYLKVSYREEGVDFFSMAPESKTRTNGWKLYRGRLIFKIRRIFLTMVAVKQFSSLLPRVIGAPSLEVFKQQLNSHLVWGFLGRSQEVRLENFQSYFQPYNSVCSSKAIG